MWPGRHVAGRVFPCPGVNHPEGEYDVLMQPVSAPDTVITVRWPGPLLDRVDRVRAVETRDRSNMIRILTDEGLTAGQLDFDTPLAAGGLASARFGDDLLARVDAATPEGRTRPDTVRAAVARALDARAAGP